MKLIKIIIIISISGIFLLGCQDVKDGFTGKKVSKGDEFLIKKKNSLVVPPDFDQLPEPKLEEINESVSEDQDIKKLLGVSEKKNTSNKSTKSKNSTEDSILKKINKN